MAVPASVKHHMARLRLRVWFGFAGLVAASAAYTERAPAQSTAPGNASAAADSAPTVDPAAVAAAPATPQTGMALPGAAPGPGADADDHLSVIRHFGIGYLGRRSIAIDADPATGAVTTVDAPVIGARYWLDPLVGIDAGLGLLLSTGSSRIGNSTTDLQGYTVFILHGGVPLALAGSKHFSFQVTPELNLGVASSQRGGTGPDLTGFHLDVGARAGAEIQFGFIGIPELSLQAGVGVALAYDHVNISPAVGDSASVNHTALGTSVGNEPWNVFTGNVAALYYFD